MYEYRVEKCMLKEAEELMNSFAQDGWRVISAVPTFQGFGYDFIIIFERASF